MTSGFSSRPAGPSSLRWGRFLGVSSQELGVSRSRPCRADSSADSVDTADSSMSASKPRPCQTTYLSQVLGHFGNGLGLLIIRLTSKRPNNGSLSPPDVFSESMASLLGRRVKDATGDGGAVPSAVTRRASC